MNLEWQVQRTISVYFWETYLYGNKVAQGQISRCVKSWGGLKTRITCKQSCTLSLNSASEKRELQRLPQLSAFTEIMTHFSAKSML